MSFLTQTVRQVLRNTTQLVSLNGNVINNELYIVT